LSRYSDSSGVDTLENLQLLAAFPEWETELEGGVTTSKTDVLAICRMGKGLCVLAVEAKVDEEFGPRRRKRTESSPGQSARLKYLQNLLGIAELRGTIRYQLLHRTASALLTEIIPCPDGVMLVQAFGDKFVPASGLQSFRRNAECTGSEARFVFDSDNGNAHAISGVVQRRSAILGSRAAAGRLRLSIGEGVERVRLVALLDVYAGGRQCTLADSDAKSRFAPSHKEIAG